MHASQVSTFQQPSPAAVTKADFILVSWSPQPSKMSLCHLCFRRTTTTYSAGYSENSCDLCFTLCNRLLLGPDPAATDRDRQEQTDSVRMLSLIYTRQLNRGQQMKGEALWIPGTQQQRSQLHQLCSSVEGNRGEECMDHVYVAPCRFPHRQLRDSNRQPSCYRCALSTPTWDGFFHSSSVFLKAVSCLH